jgi:hypothetical protein
MADQEYNKLVWDKIPNIISQSGKAPITRTLGEKEYAKALQQKFLASPVFKTPFGRSTNRIRTTRFEITSKNQTYQIPIIITNISPNAATKTAKLKLAHAPQGVQALEYKTKTPLA